jgi:hypothetical protein
MDKSSGNKVFERRAGANVGFELVLSCRPGQRLLVIAATQSNTFTPLEAPMCP